MIKDFGRQSVKKLKLLAEACVVYGLFFFFKRLPPALASSTGGFLARKIGPLLPITKIARINLEMVFPALQAAEKQKIILEMWDNLGRNVAEFPHLVSLKETEKGPGYEIIGADYLRSLAEKGGPALFTTAHIGNWEILPKIVSSFGVPMSFFYRPPSNPYVDRLTLQVRREALGEGTPVFQKGEKGSRQALQYLKKGGFLGMLVDQKLDNGLSVPLLGLNAGTTPALAAYALKFGCPVVPGHIERIGPARLRLIVEKPFLATEITDASDKNQALFDVTLKINQIFEAWVKENPPCWLWIHRRWPKEHYRSAKKD